MGLHRVLGRRGDASRGRFRHRLVVVRVIADQRRGERDARGAFLFSPSCCHFCWAEAAWVQLFFWFFPPGPEGSLDDLIFWYVAFPRSFHTGRADCSARCQDKWRSRLFVARGRVSGERGALRISFLSRDPTLIFAFVFLLLCFRVWYLALLCLMLSPSLGPGAKPRPPKTSSAGPISLVFYLLSNPSVPGSHRAHLPHAYVVSFVEDTWLTT